MKKESMKKKSLILALMLAVAISGGVYAYTYTTASGTIGATADDDIATVQAAAEVDQPDWDSLTPTPGGTETLRPNAAGDEGNISNAHGAAYPDHYQNVDDVTPDGLITDVYSDESAWARDLYNIEDHSLGTDIITAVRIYAHAMSDDLPIQTSIKIVFKSGATVTEGIEQTITTSWADYSQTWITNPATGAAFTWTDIDSLQIGISLREANSGKESFVTQVYVEVDYGEPISGEAPTGDLFTITPEGDYTGDLQVRVYLANTDALTKAYSYLNIKLYLESSVEAGETPNYQLLTLENGVATFNLRDFIGGVALTLSVTGGSYSLVSDDTSEWDAGYSLTPEFYCDVTQR
jgi:hypothetical protein